MTELTPAAVAVLLARAGLVSEIFDPVEIAADLNERSELGNSLDELLDPAGRPDPTAFDVRWR